MEKRKPQGPVDGIANRNLQKTLWRVLKKLKTELPYDPENLLLGILPEKNKNTNSKRYMHPKIHSSTIYTWKEPIRQVDLKTFCMAHGILTNNVILPFVTM